MSIDAVGAGFSMTRRIFAAAVLAGMGLGWALPAAADTWTDYSDIGPDLLTYQNTYPTICQRYDLGLSVQGRHLWAIRISDNVGVEEDEPEFKYISTMHGDEIVGAKMCMNLIDYLLTNYGSDSQVNNIVDEIDLWIVPLMNPDGYESVPRTRYASGIDLNRDFPEGVYGDPNTTTGRAPETAVIMNWSFGQSFTCSANFHGGSLVANYPFDNDGLGSVFSPTPDENMFVYISEEYSQYNLPMWNSSSFFHGITNGAEWYTIDGGMQDWNYRYMGNNEITIELGTQKEPPASQIPTFWNDNRDSMLAYLHTCLIGVRGVVTDGGTGQPLAATVRVVGRNHDVYTDPDVGDYHRMLLPGTYDLTFEGNGYDMVAVNDVVVGSGDATRVDVAMFGPPQIVAPNGGEVLTAGASTDVTWAGSLSYQYHVQYTDNYGNVGLVSDGFESGLGPDYTTGGDRSWYVTGSAAHSGSVSARAGAITHNEETWLSRPAAAGPLSFWYRVSSEPDYDFFNFYVDGDRKVHESGTVAWTLYSTTLPAGNHVLTWEYKKDQSLSNGSDTAWIDDVELTADNTTWTDIVALTGTGVTSTPWTPAASGSDYKVRVRAYYGGGVYGSWDESDATFSVAASSADADYDGDEDVDLEDYSAFQLCFGSAATGPCADAFEFVVDGVIDLDDYAEFEARLIGP